MVILMNLFANFNMRFACGVGLLPFSLLFLSFPSFPLFSLFFLSLMMKNFLLYDRYAKSYYKIKIYHKISITKSLS